MVGMVGWCVLVVRGGWLERKDGMRAERELVGEGKWVGVVYG